MATSRCALDGTSSCPTDLRPPVSTFSPSLWGDTFCSYSVDDQLQAKYAEAIEMLKEEAMKMLIITGGSTKTDKLILVDTLERLGIAYHFEKEIENQLHLIFKHHTSDSDSENGDLFSVALEFRLLRQHHYRVSSGVFDQFKDQDNKFDEIISCNAEGLLSLYEAAEVRINGEEILDEVMAFAKHHLNRLLPELESPLKEKVKRALTQSLHRGVPIIEARNYISIYEKDDTKNELLLKFAKINFNFLQNLYKKELFDISRYWWNEFDLKSKLPYVRDRLVECYLWGVAFHFEPQYSFVRAAVCKGMQLVSIVDDTYDNYATLEEAELFTEILERWDVAEIDRLPDYMKIVYRFVLSTYEGFEREASKQERSFVIPYAREEVKRLGKAYLRELKWFMGRQMPSFEEYFANTVITSCICMMFTDCFIGIGSASEETTQWLVTAPKIVVATAKMGRYVEDLASCERENRDGQMLTAVDCYMKQYGVSKEETLAKFVELADEGWKDLNTEMFSITSFVPEEIMDMFLNYARVAEVTYKNCHDGYTNPEKFLAPQIAALLIDPILI